MIGEFSFYGIFFPWLMIQGLITLALSWALRKVFARAGLYRFVWHPALFDTALFFVLLYLVYLLSPILLKSS